MAIDDNHLETLNNYYSAERRGGAFDEDFFNLVISCIKDTQESLIELEEKTGPRMNKAQRNAIKTMLWMAYSTNREVSEEEFEAFYAYGEFEELGDRFVAMEERGESSWPIES